MSKDFEIRKIAGLINLIIKKKKIIYIYSDLKICKINYLSELAIISHIKARLEN